MEAVKQGSVCLALKSDEFAVQKKFFLMLLKIIYIQRCFAVLNVHRMSWRGTKKRFLK